jgi:long-chain acyl-CoA synthetase
LVTNAIAKLEAAPQFEQDLRLNILPFCHAYARTCELSTWVLSNSRLAIARNWSDFLRQASRLHPTLINLVPHLANKLLHDERTKQQLAPTDVVGRLGGKVRLLQVGGAAIADALWHGLERCGLPPLQGYGLTEASPVVCSNREGKQRPGTIGPPVAGVEVRVDTDKQLWVRGDNVMCGYYRDREATQARIQDGWLATGDLVEQDHLGHYRVIGRMSEVIALSTGFKVSPELIEARLSNIPCIERVLIVGQDKPYTVAMIWPAWSTLPANLFADVSQSRDSMDLRAFYKDLADFVGQRLADLPIFMHPQKFILVTDSLSSDSELVNPKGNLRRNLTITRLQTQIDKAYS